MVQNNVDNITISQNLSWFNYNSVNTNFNNLEYVKHSLYNYYQTDIINILNLFSNNNFKNLSGNIVNFYFDNYYRNICIFNTHYLTYTVNVNYYKLQYLNFIFFLNKFFKITLFLIIIYTIFFITGLYTYTKQLLEINYSAKFFILNESEKEIGPVDDLFFFVILFILTLFSFIFCSFFFFIIHGKFFIWSFTALILIMILILSIPVNLFIDFGFYFFAYIRGSASSGNYIKELLFDIISTFTIFIRFIIQNIRFLFIFSAIFELLEWIFSINSNIFFFFNVDNHNYILNLTNITSIFNSKSTNLIIINLIMFVILYFYYTLHLLFLLLVQIVIYIGISSWLFFFLYSTKFLNKHEKFFLYKKNF